MATWTIENHFLSGQWWVCRDSESVSGPTQIQAGSAGGSSRYAEGRTEERTGGKIAMSTFYKINSVVLQIIGMLYFTIAVKRSVWDRDFDGATACFARAGAFLAIGLLP